MRAVNDRTATNVAQTVINGVNRKTAEGPIFMPAFGEDIRMTYCGGIQLLTARFGAEGADPTAQDVAALRKQAAEQPNSQEAPMADTPLRFAQSDGYISELIREVTTMPAEAPLDNGTADLLQARRRRRRGAGPGISSGGRGFADTATESGDTSHQCLHSHRPR